MPAAPQIPTLPAVPQGHAAFPQRLNIRLGPAAPATLSIIGDFAPLQGSTTGFLCSKETPGETMLEAFDQATDWRDAGVCVISGFHSPLEQQCLDILLRGKQPIVWVLARGIVFLRLPKPKRAALDDGRLTVVSPFTASETRISTDLARQRNRVVDALTAELVYAHISSGGSLTATFQQVVHGLKLLIVVVATQHNPAETSCEHPQEC